MRKKLSAKEAQEAFIEKLSGKPGNIQDQVAHYKQMQRELIHLSAKYKMSRLEQAKKALREYRADIAFYAGNAIAAIAHQDKIDDTYHVVTVRDPHSPHEFRYLHCATGCVQFSKDWVARATLVSKAHEADIDKFIRDFPSLWERLSQL